MSSPTCDSDYKYVATAEVESFVERCMIAVGTDPQHSNALAQVLREADYRGHVSHGLNRLGKDNLYPFPPKKGRTINVKAPQHFQILFVSFSCVPRNLESAT